MSMLTEQCARLRKTAKAYEDVAPNTAALMREAADTIAALRNRLTETCHDTGEDPTRFVCSECGGVEGETLPRYCPNCGAEVVV
jgi:rubrerythrin